MLRDAETTSIAERMRRSPLGGDAFSPPPRRRARCFFFFFTPLSNNTTDQILLRRRRGLLRTNTRSMTLVLGSVARLGGARLFRSKI